MQERSVDDRRAVWNESRSEWMTGDQFSREEGDVDDGGSVLMTDDS
jgi:hypothetical protein